MLPFREMAEVFHKQWLAYVESLRQSDAMIGEPVITGGLEHFPKPDIGSPARMVAQQMTSALIKAAVAQHSVPHGPLRIDSEDVLKRFASDYRSFDPREVAQHIEQQYTSDAEDLIFAEHAQTLIKMFRIGRDNAKPIENVKGGMRLVREVMQDPYRTTNRVELSYNSRNNIRKIHESFAVFLSWAGETDTATKVQETTEQFGKRYLDREDEYKSGQRFDFGPGAHLVAYKTSFKYWFSADVFTQLQVFLSTYGLPAQEAA